MFIYTQIEIQINFILWVAIYFNFNYIFISLTNFKGTAIQSVAEKFQTKFTTLIYNSITTATKNQV